MIHEDKEAKHMAISSAILFIAAVLTSFIGSILTTGTLQAALWEIGDMFSVVGCSIVLAILIRDRYDFVSAGFTLIIVAEGFNIAAAANAEHLDFSLYSAGVMLYFPGFIIIGIYSGFKWWIRICCLLLCIPFGIEEYSLTVHNFDPQSPINSAGYILKSLVYIGWAISLFRIKPGEKLY